MLLIGLTAAIPCFPFLTARLARDLDTTRPFFDTGAGALIVEAVVPAVLTDHLPLASTSLWFSVRALYN